LVRPRNAVQRGLAPRNLAVTARPIPLARSAGIGPESPIISLRTVRPDGSLPPSIEAQAMIDRTQLARPKSDHRDELSMRVMEYALAFLALAAALLLAPR
jgi:hypothetical protein